MLKLFSTHLAMCFIFASCLNERLSFLDSAYKKDNPLSAHQDRLPAKSDISCLKDNFNITFFKKEIFKLESELNLSVDKRGSFAHLNYSDLPAASILFLEQFSQKSTDKFFEDKKHFQKNIKKESFGELGAVYDFSSCTDIPCLINVVYKSPEGISGYFTYYWYLKMGHLLSFDNLIQGQKSDQGSVYYKDAKHKFEDYLWKEQEFHDFFVAQHYMPESFVNLSNLRVVERTPSIMGIENIGPLTAGVASSAGYIIFRKGESSYGTYSNQGATVFGIVHEYAHIYEYLYQINNKEYLSNTKKWLDTKKWKKLFFNRKDGSSTYQWKSDDRIDSFVSRYASSSPAEHFAESIRYYSLDPQLFYSKSTPSEFSIIKEVFGELEFDSKKIKEKLSLDLKMNLIKDIREIEINCKSLSNNCIQEKTQIALKSHIEILKESDYFACQAFEDSEVENDVIDYASANVSSFIQKWKPKDYKITEDLKAEVGFLYYLECSSDDDTKSCYNEKISSYLSTFLSDENTQIENDLIELFKSKNNFTQIQSKVYKKYSNALVVLAPYYMEEVQSIMLECKSVAEKSNEAYLSGDFSSGEIFIKPSVINCINQSDLVNRVLQASNSEFPVGDVELNYLSKLLKAKIQQTLSQTFLNQAQIEKISTLNVIESGEASVTNKIIFNLDWVRPYDDKIKLMASCISKLRGENSLKLVYHLEKDFVLGRYKEICTNILDRGSFISAKEKLEKLFEEQYEKTWSSIFNEETKRSFLNCRRDLSDDRGKFKRGQVKKCLNNKYRKIILSSINKVCLEPYKKCHDQNKLAQSEVSKNESVFKDLYRVFKEL